MKYILYQPRKGSYPLISQFMKTYPVNEMFYTWQGEGIHAGRAAFFVRLHGCPIKCPWCDSAGTWHPKYVPSNVTRMTAAEIGKAARETDAQFVVVTGGEPTIHDLRDLTACLSESQDESHASRILPCHLETSGAFEIKGDFSFITVSPKRERLPLDENLEKASEIKLIIDSPKAFTEWDAYLDNHYFKKAKQFCSVWLHPEWSKRADKEVLTTISNAVKRYPALYRAGWQLHKLYQVDSLDARSRPIVPLGGDINKGY